MKVESQRIETGQNKALGFGGKDLIKMAIGRRLSMAMVDQIEKLNIDKELEVQKIAEHSDENLTTE